MVFTSGQLLPTYNKTMRAWEGTLLGLVCLVRLSGQAPATFSFEDNMEGWESDAAMPQGLCTRLPLIYPECFTNPTPPAVDKMAAIRRTAERAFDGTHSVKFTLDGTSDEGTAWILRSFPAAAARRYRVALQFYVTGAPWPNIAYAGPSRPRASTLAQGPPQTDFLVVGGQCVQTTVPGWFQCSYLTEVTTDASGLIWAGIGIWADYEVGATFYLDDVSVTINPVGDQTTTAALGMSPDSGSGSGSDFTTSLAFVFEDTNGWQDLGVVNVLINNGLNPVNACYLAYVPTMDVLYLVNDAGTALLPGTRPLHNGTKLTNGQCTVQPIDVRYGANGESLSLLLAIEFKQGFSGKKTFFTAARDLQGNNNTGWQTVGTWTVP